MVHARTSGSNYSIVVSLDDRWAQAKNGPARFDGLVPGSHKLRVRSYGFGQRDTLITLPADSSLEVKVALTRGGGLGYCASYIRVDSAP